jgi:hypothetical protein
MRNEKEEYWEREQQEQEEEKQRQQHEQKQWHHQKQQNHQYHQYATAIETLNHVHQLVVYLVESFSHSRFEVQRHRPPLLLNP